MATEPPGVYVDASAVVKLIVPEEESSHLQRYLAGRPLISSEIVGIEVPRAVVLRSRAIAAAGEAEQLLRELVLLVRLDDELRATAARVGPPALRSLDAIHLASALRVRDEIDAGVVYARRLAEAASAAGLPVGAPGR